jgi:hypothetical protein
MVACGGALEPLPDCRATETMPPLDRFGKFVIEYLRDAPLDRLEQLLAGEMKSPDLQQLQQGLRDLDQETVALVRKCVEVILNAALHGFLFALAENNDRKGDVVVMAEGVNVATKSDGLQGEPYGNRGWIAKLSRHPAT